MFEKKNNVKKRSFSEIGLFSFSTSPRQRGGVTRMALVALMPSWSPFIQQKTTFFAIGVADKKPFDADDPSVKKSIFLKSPENRFFDDLKFLILFFVALLRDFSEIFESLFGTKTRGGQGRPQVANEFSNKARNVLVAFLIWRPQFGCLRTTTAKRRL